MKLSELIKMLQDKLKEGDLIVYGIDYLTFVKKEEDAELKVNS